MVDTFHSIQKVVGITEPDPYRNPYTFVIHFHLHLIYHKSRQKRHHFGISSQRAPEQTGIDCNAGFCIGSILFDDLQITVCHCLFRSFQLLQKFIRIPFLSQLFFMIQSSSLPQI